MSDPSPASSDDPPLFRPEVLQARSDTGTGYLRKQLVKEGEQREVVRAQHGRLTCPR